MYNMSGNMFDDLIENPQPLYHTTDLTIAATLNYFSFPVHSYAPTNDDPRNPSKTRFRFIQTPELMELVDKVSKQQVTVEPYRFQMSVRFIKRLINSQND